MFPKFKFKYLLLLFKIMIFKGETIVDHVELLLPTFKIIVFKV